jgi:hypothetical protein
MRREKTQISKTETKKEITTNTKEIKGIIRLL